MNMARSFNNWRKYRQTINELDRMTARELRDLGIEHGERVDIVAGDRVFGNQTAVAHPIARGSIAAYYPEANCLVSLGDHDAASGTPAYKSIPVKVVRAA